MILENYYKWRCATAWNSILLLRFWFRWVVETAPRLLNFSSSLKYVVTSHFARNTQGRNPHTNWRRCQLASRTFMDALHYVWIETRFFGRPVLLLGLIYFQLQYPSLLYRPDLGPDHVGFVVDSIITREVCLWGHKIFCQYRSTKCPCAYFILPLSPL
jgi:hypothetical protein